METNENDQKSMKITKNQWKSQNIILPLCCMLFYRLSSGFPLAPRCFLLVFLAFHCLSLRVSMFFIVFHCFSLIFIDFHCFSLFFIDFHCFSLGLKQKPATVTILSGQLWGVKMLIFWVFCKENRCLEGSPKKFPTPIRRTRSKKHAFPC